MKNKWVILSIVAVVVVVAAGYFAVFYQNNDYSVVYMASGEVYIGKLTTFPSLKLKDGYIFQAVKDEKDPSKVNFKLNPISEALWAPKQMYLNKDQVVFYGPLLETGKIAETIKAQAK